MIEWLHVGYDAVRQMSSGGFEFEPELGSNILHKIMSQLLGS